ncbi:ABC transporter ATP-binding protein [Cuniculiplasma divulgatum]|uniref:ABC transporter ATPase n=1 Tax=Cuniculiplasma divulgatum TaxID=1673428 RepID=A0A1N5WCT3_9ARCH|nr:ATP-binding cassette domain-containing protein [Cuniculiplasma divulgatum]MCL4320431.1 ATP-binding cassette domain-containing protein [Candidatus Thermoplasmatota archaeon]SIM82475.1 ABC transporter ATPase [Cuniculiplasma divulgatum]
MKFEVNHVKVSYAKNRSLSDLNVSIVDGITIIIGHNGVGKSSLISVIEGLAKIEGKDEVKVGGHLPYYNPDLAFRDVSFLPERPLPIGGFTVMDWIEFYSGLRKINFERLKMIMEELGVYGLKRARTKYLSMGETQLISMSICLSTECKFFVLDEPNSNIDLENRNILANIIQRLRHENDLSFIIVSHILDDLLPIAENIVIFRPEKIIGPIPIKTGIGENLFSIKLREIDQIVKKIEGKLVYKIIRNNILIRDEDFKNFISSINADQVASIMSIIPVPRVMEDEFSYVQKP